MRGGGPRCSGAKMQSLRCGKKKESIFQMKRLRVRVLHPLLVSHSVTSCEAFIYTSDSYTLWPAIESGL